MSQTIKLSCKGKCEYLELSNEKKCCSKMTIDRDEDDIWIGIHDYKGKLLGDLFLDPAKQKELIKFLQIPHKGKSKEKSVSETNDKLFTEPNAGQNERPASEKGDKNEINDRSNIGLAA